jgi:hypothetical protein
MVDGVGFVDELGQDDQLQQPGQPVLLKHSLPGCPREG